MLNASAMNHVYFIPHSSHGYSWPIMCHKIALYRYWKSFSVISSL